MEVSGLLHALAALSLVERISDTHWIGGWLWPRADLNVVRKRKFLASAGNRILVVQRVATNFIDCELSRLVSFVSSLLRTFEPIYEILYRPT
jgi:hypothetical protein